MFSLSLASHTIKYDKLFPNIDSKVRQTYCEFKCMCLLREHFRCASVWKVFIRYAGSRIHYPIKHNSVPNPDEVVSGTECIRLSSLGV